MAEIYIDSDKEVLKINGKCYYKVVGDKAYRTHLSNVIEDDFNDCRDCYEITTIAANTTFIVTGSIPNLRFRGQPGETALLVFDDGTNIFNIPIANINGDFIWDYGNSNGVEHNLGTPPQSYTFTLGGLTHTINFTRLGSFIFDVEFNITNVQAADPGSMRTLTQSAALDAWLQYGKRAKL